MNGTHNSDCTKICRKCTQLKSVDSFTKKSTICKSCKREYDKEYNKTNCIVRKERAKRYREEHVEGISKSKHEKWLKHKEKGNLRAKQWYQRNKDAVKLRTKKYKNEHPELYREYGRKRDLRLKKTVFQYYSEGTMKCACCGETTFSLLTLDHINNDGAEHRRQLNVGGGLTFYRRLKKLGYPPGYQVLCWNCNSGKAINNGVCPHKELIKQSDTMDYINIKTGGCNEL